MKRWGRIDINNKFTDKVLEGCQCSSCGQFYSVYDILAQMSINDDSHTTLWDDFVQLFPDIANQCKMINFDTKDVHQSLSQLSTPAASIEVLELIKTHLRYLPGIYYKEDILSSKRVPNFTTSRNRDEVTQEEINEYYNRPRYYSTTVLVDSLNTPKIKIGNSKKQLIFNLLRKDKQNLKIILFFGVMFSNVLQRDIINWFKLWAGQEDYLITPSKRKIRLHKNVNSNKVEFIYFVYLTELNAIKIGRAKDVEKRLNSLQTACPVKLKLLKVEAYTAGDEAIQAEKIFHVKFEHLRMEGEWFRYEKELKEYINNHQEH